MLTHGNGPQVGNMLIQNELAAKTVAPMPMDVCGAETQGQIGYMPPRACPTTCACASRRRRWSRSSPGRGGARDKAFASPTKPVGPFYSEAGREDDARGGAGHARGRGTRLAACGAHPEPREIVELEAVRDLVDGGCLVVCAGGGGVPVVRSRGALSGIDAVIDKDLAAALLARELGADALLILTDVTKARALRHARSRRRSTP